MSWAETDCPLFHLLVWFDCQFSDNLFTLIWDQSFPRSSSCNKHCFRSVFRRNAGPFRYSFGYFLVLPCCRIKMRSFHCLLLRSIGCSSHDTHTHTHIRYTIQVRHYFVFLKNESLTLAWLSPYLFEMKWLLDNIKNHTFGFGLFLSQFKIFFPWVDKERDRKQTNLHTSIVNRLIFVLSVVTHFGG